MLKYSANHTYDICFNVLIFWWFFEQFLAGYDEFLGKRYLRTFNSQQDVHSMPASEFTILITDMWFESPVA